MYFIDCLCTLYRDDLSLNVLYKYILLTYYDQTLRPFEYQTLAGSDTELRLFQGEKVPTEGPKATPHLHYTVVLQLELPFVPPFITSSYISAEMKVLVVLHLSTSHMLLRRPGWS